jgi:predicted DCC family thiol-disulfide oxidoreductase YuxK
MNQSQTQTKKISDSEILKVLYDGSCPMCRAEITHVKNLANKTPSSGLIFIDISSNNSESAYYQKDKEQLLARFHVECIDRSRIDGAKAFVAMWKRLPGWQWVARLSKIPGMLFLMELTYKRFLKIRPSIQSLFRKLFK